MLTPKTIQSSPSFAAQTARSGSASTFNPTAQSASSLRSGSRSESLCSIMCRTHEALAELLQEIGNDPRAAIINASFPGIPIGEEFVILSEREIEERLGIPATDRAAQQGVHEIDFEGKAMKAMGRFKENVRPSSWQLLDRDVDSHTPDQFASLSTEDWLRNSRRSFPASTRPAMSGLPRPPRGSSAMGEPVGARQRSCLGVRRGSRRYRTCALHDHPASDAGGNELDEAAIQQTEARRDRGSKPDHDHRSERMDAGAPGLRWTAHGGGGAHGPAIVLPRSDRNRTDELDTSAMVMPDRKTIRELSKVGCHVSGRRIARTAAHHRR
jgi:hypothetical protein